ncbi:MAG: hypothetical protein IIB94_06375 [Candidatus Marinimicrobia bacterium]|nr:hypothetical protein [Candidatus Neomarinimicrobiota bacterium]
MICQNDLSDECQAGGVCHSDVPYLFGNRTMLSLNVDSYFNKTIFLAWIKSPACPLDVGRAWRR